MSAERDKNYSEVSVKREEIDGSLNVDCAAVELNDLTFRRLKHAAEKCSRLLDEKNDIDDRIFRRTSHPAGGMMTIYG